MYDTYEADLLGPNEILGPIIAIIVIGSILLSVLGVIYAIRSWMAQSAAFKTRKDVAEIKRMLEDMNQSAPAPSVAPKTDNSSTDGRHIAAL